MHDIICPHCNKAFKVDEAGYADILKQVRDSEFDQQLHDRLELAEKDKLKEVELAKSNIRNDMQEVTASKDAEIKKLEAKLEAEEVARKLAVSEALKAVEKERDALANELDRARRDSQAALELAEAKKSEGAAAQKLAISEALSTVEKERDELKSNLKQAELEKQLSEKSLKDKYETQIKDRDDAIERLKDMKARLSTKMVGETLEQHCETEFNRIRATAFPNAYFEKDNENLFDANKKNSAHFLHYHYDSKQISTSVFLEGSFDEAKSFSQCKLKYQTIRLVLSNHMTLNYKADNTF